MPVFACLFGWCACSTHSPCWRLKCFLFSYKFGFAYSDIVLLTLFSGNILKALPGPLLFPDVCIYIRVQCGWNDMCFNDNILLLCFAIRRWRSIECRKFPEKRSLTLVSIENLSTDQSLCQHWKQSILFILIIFFYWEVIGGREKCALFVQSSLGTCVTTWNGFLLWLLRVSCINMNSTLDPTVHYGNLSEWDTEFNHSELDTISSSVAESLAGIGTAFLLALLILVTAIGAWELVSSFHRVCLVQCIFFYIHISCLLCFL